MARIVHPFLFSWKEIEGSSELERLSLVLAALPDEKLVSTLEQGRGKGRNDYPIRADLPPRVPRGGRQEP